MAPPLLKTLRDVLPFEACRKSWVPLEVTSALVDELLVDVGELCVHNFAHHVMESILENGEVPRGKTKTMGDRKDWKIGQSSLFSCKFKPSK